MNEALTQTHEDPQDSLQARAPAGTLHAPVSLPLHAAHIAAASAAARASQHPPQPPPLHILRSSALDAGRLDTELTSLLGEQLSKMFALFHPGQIMEWDAEVNAVLNLLVFGASVWQSPTAATPGSALLNLKYRSEDAPGAALLPAGLQHWLARLRNFFGSSVTSSSKPSTPLTSHSLHPGKSLSSLPPGSQSNTPLPSGAAAATGATASSHPPSHFDSSRRSLGLLGGRTGVEGPSLSISQRVLLVLGMVALPYAWARMGRRLTAASVGGSGSASSNSMGSRDVGAQHGSPAAAGAHRSNNDGDGSGASDGGGVIGAALKCVGLGHMLPPVLAWQANCGSAFRDQWLGATQAVRRVWSMLDARLGWRLMRGVETAFKGAALLNFLAFLAGGKYRSLLERLVGARLVYKQPSMARVISFEYLNRQLVWHEISELLLLLLPLLDAAKFRRGLGRLMPRLPSPASVLQRLASNGSSEGDHNLNSSATESAQYPPSTTTAGFNAQATAATIAAGGVAAERGSQEEDERRGHLAEDGKGEGGTDRPKGPCPVCGTKEMLQPVVALPCRHVFCYYCLSASCMADRWYECPLDGVRVAAMIRWRP